MSTHYQEDARLLAEFYPDGDHRHRMHYAFAHQFLPYYVHQNAFPFINSGADPTKFVQARWQMMETMMGLQQLGSHVFRRVMDLKSEACDFGSYPGVLIEMPKPERCPCAFFAGAVLVMPKHVFAALQQCLSRAMTEAPLKITDAERDQLRSVRARLFTLERGEKYNSAHGPGTTFLCEWMSQHTRAQHSQDVPVTKAAFVAAATAILQRDGQAMTVTSNNRRIGIEQVTVRR